MYTHRLSQSLTHKTEPCLSDALGDAFGGVGGGSSSSLADKIRSPGAVFTVHCASVCRHTHTWTAMLGLDLFARVTIDS